MFRVVLDTNVIVSAVVSGGKPRQLLDKGIDGRFQIVVSEFILKEDGTRQRHIPRRKVLAELRTATKYAVPMILFVMNFTNGRIWAKVIPVNELKDFPGQTTPPMLVENDPQAANTCKETLQMALNLL